MNAKIWIPLSAATLTGAAAAWAGYQLIIQQPQGESAPQVQLEPVVVASRMLPAGTRLSEQDLAIMRVEQGSMSTPTVGKPEVLVGRVISEAVRAGQPMNSALLASEGTVPGLSATLPNGYRAITLQVDPFHGLDGFLVPEAHVDVIAALGTGDNAAARTIAQNVRVLAVGGRLKGESMEQTGEEKASLGSNFNVTLMVTPQQAAAIELAADGGTPRLMLRPGADTELHEFEGLTLAELRGEAFGTPFGHGGATTPVSPWDNESTPVTPVESQPVITITPIEPAQQANTNTATNNAGGGTDTGNNGATGTSDPIATPGQVGGQPGQNTTPGQQTKPLPRMHVVEIIRAGVTTRIALPAPSVGEGKTRQPERAVANSDTAPAAE